VNRERVRSSIANASDLERPNACYLSAMAALNLDDLLTLDVASRLALIAKLWDSVVEDSRALPITESESVLLDQRLKEDDDAPDAAIPWEVARTALLQPR
jgi:putative addiction module component (TIGR02574 family)